jgi:hypothetical protein
MTMPASPWLLHFPDDQQTEVAASRTLPRTGDEILSGWIVTDCKVSNRSARDRVDVWVTAKGRRKTIRQRTDRP